MRWFGLLGVVMLVACGSRTTLNGSDVLVDDEPSGVGAASSGGGGGGGTSAAVVDLEACRESRESYSYYRRQMQLAFQPSSCSVDADCVSYVERNNCATDTCELVVSRSQVPALEEDLQGYANGVCPAGCPSTESVACSTAHCFRGNCE
jgi:hypothetical protein